MKLKADLRLITNLLTPLIKNFLVPLELKADVLATDAAIQENIFGSGANALIISNKEMEHIMKIIKSLEESSLLVEGVSETIKKEAKKQESGFTGML